MSLHRFVQSGLVIGAVWIGLTAHPSAGTFFRLEVGPPVAAGTQTKYKKAALAVRPLACNDQASVQINGTAEGIVNGVRQSIPLMLFPTGTDGVHVVPQAWSSEGSWLVNLTGTCSSPKSSAGTIAPIGKAGFIREKVQILREPATHAQIEAALADLVRTQS